MEENRKTDPEVSWLKREGILVAALPVAAYLLTYLYEAGYSKFFGIPIEFVSPNWTTVFIATGVLLGLAMVLFFLVNPFFMVLGAPATGPIRRRIRRLWVPILFWLAYLILFAPYTKEWIALFILLLILGLFEFVFPLIAQRGKGTYLEKLAAQDTTDDQLEDLMDVAVRRLGLSAFSFLLLVFMLGCISYAAGRAAAMKQENFLVLEDDPSTVILRIYGDRLITARYDQQAKLVSKKFKSLSTDGTALRLEKVGPLKAGTQ